MRFTTDRPAKEQANEEWCCVIREAGKGDRWKMRKAGVMNEAERGRRKQ